MWIKMIITGESCIFWNSRAIIQLDFKISTKQVHFTSTFAVEIPVTIQIVTKHPVKRFDFPFEPYSPNIFFVLFCLTNSQYISNSISELLIQTYLTLKNIYIYVYIHFH